MKISTIVGGLAACATAVSGLVTTGATGGVAVRQEVRDLLNIYPRQFTLFLLAMQQWQAQQQANPTSYYSISGIHGVPRQNFDGVPQCSSCQGTDGYCTHDSILFMPWHRTYLALFEQQLQAIAKSIANKYPVSANRTAYQQAAKNLRLPYWDWAAHPPSGYNVLPGLVVQPSVTLQAPAGSTTIPNPLYQYKFQSTSGMYYPQFQTWQQTMRYPSSNAASATSNQAADVAAFNNIRGSLQDRLYQLFTTCTNYEMIGLDTAGSANAACASSLEGLHNTIHTTSGGPPSLNPAISGGHMTYLATAAFDPIFWLHHVNVDRIFAMWQAVYPNSYGGTQTNLTTPTWTYPKGSNLGPNSPLTPFHKDSSGSFWTTNSVQNIKTFGYTYPEFANSNGNAAAIKSYINNLYGPSATATAGSSKRTAVPSPGSATGLLGSSLNAPLKAANGSIFQYVANIQTSRYALNGSYNIFLFNGNPTTTNTDLYLQDPALIGPLGVLASSMDGMDVTITGSIPLTRSLAASVTKGLLSDLTEALVVPYLVKNLKWIIVGPDGQTVDADSIPDFDVTVYASTASAVAADEFPVWSDFIKLEDVTNAINAGVTTVSGSASPTATATATSVASGANTTGTVSAATTTAAQGTATAAVKSSKTKTQAAATPLISVGLQKARKMRRAE